MLIGYSAYIFKIGFFGIALRYRYKRDLHKRSRVTPPQGCCLYEMYGTYITRNATIYLYIYLYVTLRVYVYVTLRVHAPQG